jgi:hypothetical protein
MAKRRADAHHRRFLDEFECVKIPRLRAMGVVQLDAPHAIIRVGGRQKQIGLAHVPVQERWVVVTVPLPAVRAPLQSALAHPGQAALRQLLQRPEHLASHQVGLRTPRTPESQRQGPR